MQSSVSFSNVIVMVTTVLFHLTNLSILYINISDCKWLYLDVRQKNYWLFLFHRSRNEIVVLQLMWSKWLSLLQSLKKKCCKTWSSIQMFCMGSLTLHKHSTYMKTYALKMRKFTVIKSLCSLSRVKKKLCKKPFVFRTQKSCIWSLKFVESPR